MTTQAQLHQHARRLAELLADRDLKVVLAESCTGGLVSSALTTVAGISNHHCGSAVVYRIETKAEWLGVDRSDLQSAGPVSRTVARQMALGVLRRTPEADVSAAVTGHLGPDAPAAQDGLVYIAVARREKRARKPTVRIRKHWLPSTAPRRQRRQRQTEAARLVFAEVENVLAENEGRGPVCRFWT